MILDIPYTQPLLPILFLKMFSLSISINFSIFGKKGWLPRYRGGRLFLD
jgi:hypothetical protein